MTLTLTSTLDEGFSFFPFKTWIVASIWNQHAAQNVKHTKHHDSEISLMFRCLNV